MPRFSSSWYLVTCAEERLQTTSNATAHAIELSCCVRISSSLEVEVKAQHKAVTGQIGPVRCQPFASDPRILVVPGKTGAAVHDRIVAVAEHIVVEVA